MRYMSRAVVGMGMLIVVLVAGALVALAVETRLGLNAGRERTVSSHLEFSAVRQGVLGWDRVYESPLERMDLWHASSRLADMELEEGARSANRCLWLSQVQRFLVLGSTTAVKLCPAPHNGTMMYVHQTFYWRR
ncbi:MAG: hypothetical protein ABI847_03830 [Anaerolineales bacterium]